MPDGRLNLLSLDGGGVRGLSTLVILQKLMEQIDPEAPPKPCEYFDMIGGTSTGGIIAIMLGCLELTIDECILHYERISKSVFTNPGWSIDSKGNVKGKYDSKKLETAVKTILRDVKYDENTLLKKDVDIGCKVFVLATGIGSLTKTVFTTYRQVHGSIDLYKNTRIWEACRATSAAPSFFDPIYIRDRGFIDGGLGANNPVRHLWIEAKSQFSPKVALEDSLNCLVSIGTGIPELKRYKKRVTELPKAILAIATDTERTAENFLEEHEDLYDSGYFRFNAPGVGDIALDKSEEIGIIKDRTDHFLGTVESRIKYKNCAQLLLKGASRDKRVDLVSHLAGKLQLERHRRNQGRFRRVRNISHYDPEMTMARFARRRCDGTTRWIVTHPLFGSWLEGRGPVCVWLSGIVGSGKTITTTMVVETAQRMRFGDKPSPVLHYFFDPRMSGDVSGIDLLNSLVKQLIGFLKEQNTKIPMRLFETVEKFYGPESQSRGVADVSAEVLIPLVDACPGHLFIIIDGLDECARLERAAIMPILRKLIDMKVRLFISSQEEVNVLVTIPGSQRIWISKSNEGIRRDVQKYIADHIDFKMQERKLIESESLMNEVKKALINKADAMFLWVKLLINEIWEGCESENDISAALNNLPETLHDTYQRNVDRMKANVTKKGYDPRVLKWVCAARAPFLFYQLREALIINATTGELGDPKTKSSEDFILRSCANLAIIEDGYIIPAHHSVKKFVFPVKGSSTSHGSDTPESIDSELEIGALCVSHLDRTLLSVTKRTADLQLPANFLRSTAAGSALRLLVKRQGAQPSRLPATFISRPHQFLMYARRHWAAHVRHLNSTHDIYLKMVHLVQARYQIINPWPSQAELAEQDYFHGIYAWAIHNSHFSLVEMVASILARRDPMALISPLPGYGVETPLIAAAKSGTLEVFNKVLEGCCLTNLPLEQWLYVRDADGSSPLHIVGIRGFDQIMGRLLELYHMGSYTGYERLYGYKDASGNNLLHLVMIGGHVQCFRQIFSSSHMDWLLNTETTDYHVHGPWVLPQWDANLEKDLYGFTPLDLAILQGQLEIVELIFDWERMISARMEWHDSGRHGTSLLLAAQYDHWDIVRVCIDRRHLPSFEQDPDWALKLSHMAMKRLKSGSVAESIVDCIVDKLKIDDDRTLWLLAQKLVNAVITDDLVEVRNMLLVPSNKIEINRARDSSGRTAFWWAACNNSVELMEILIDAGADINKKDDHGHTPLWQAVSQGQKKTVQFLLRQDAELATDSRGMSPEEKAMAKGYFDIAQLLNEYARSLGGVKFDTY